MSKLNTVNELPIIIKLFNYLNEVDYCIIKLSSNMENKYLNEMVITIEGSKILWYLELDNVGDNDGQNISEIVIELWLEP